MTVRLGWGAGNRVGENGPHIEEVLFGRSA